MAIPYRAVSKPVATSFTAYLGVTFVEQLGKYIGGLLITDGRGQPVEFVHNYADAPSGLLWSEPEIRRVAVQSIAHSLFDGCSKSPAILFAQDSIGTPTYCTEELSPSIPFALVTKDETSGTLNVAWASQPPAPGSAASLIFDEINRRNLLMEPFSRIIRAIEEIYPEIRSQGS